MYKQNKCNFKAGKGNVAGVKTCPYSNSKLNIVLHSISEISVLPLMPTIKKDIVDIVIPSFY